ASSPLAGQSAAPPRVREQNAPASALATQPEAESELETGTALTRVGSFSAAIPHLHAARGQVRNEYAASFNLALCYVATGQPQQAVPILNELRAGNHDNADVNNLLAQAYVAARQD